MSAMAPVQPKMVASSSSSGSMMPSPLPSGSDEPWHGLAQHLDERELQVAAA